MTGFPTPRGSYGDWAVIHGMRLVEDVHDGRPETGIGHRRYHHCAFGDCKHACCGHRSRSGKKCPEGIGCNYYRYTGNKEQTA